MENSAGTAVCTNSGWDVMNYEFLHIIPLSSTWKCLLSVIYLLTLILFVFVPTDLDPKPNKPVKPPSSGGGECWCFYLFFHLSCMWIKARAVLQLEYLVYFNDVLFLCGALMSTWVVLSRIVHCHFAHAGSDNVLGFTWHLQRLWSVHHVQSIFWEIFSTQIVHCIFIYLVRKQTLQTYGLTI